MKTMNSIVTNDNKTNHSLHQLVDEIIEQLSPLYVSNKNRIVNNVPGNLVINEKGDIITSVINGLMDALMANATEGHIDISAKELFGNTIKVFVKDNNCYNTYAVACALQKMVPLAEQLGGFLNIMNQRQKITTIEFSFPVAKEEMQRADED